MKRILFFFIFCCITNSCKGIHLNIQCPLTFKEGEIKSVIISDEKLDLKVKTATGDVNISISPWKRIDAFDLNLKGMDIKSFTKVSPYGLSRVLSFYKKGKLIFIIGNKVGENSILASDFKIKRGDVVFDGEEGFLWVKLRLEGSNESIDLMPGQFVDLKTSEGDFLFLFLGASVPDPKLKRKDIAREDPPFRADYILFKEK